MGHKNLFMGDPIEEANGYFFYLSAKTRFDTRVTEPRSIANLAPFDHNRTYQGWFPLFFAHKTCSTHPT